MKSDRFSHIGRASLPTSLLCTCAGVGAVVRCLVCETERETELGCDVGLDGTRPMPAPMRTPEDYAYHARIVHRIAAVGLVAWLAIAALLRLFGARTLTP